MTAIGGFWRLTGTNDPEDACRRILAAQRIYGPDAQGISSEGDIAIGAQLKRVLPEDKFDKQPLRVGRHGVLVADVRLDNRDDLIRELRLNKEIARSSSDAHILALAIDRWKEDCFERIVGNYAIAYWDASERFLLLARDPLGHRPLFYHRAAGFIAFASMPKGLHALPEIPLKPDGQRMAEFLALFPATGTRTFFEGVERVEPGHYVKIRADRLIRQRHWNPKRSQLKLKSSKEFAEALLAHFDEAVRCRLRGQGDIGVFMSGGLDSTAVAATAARLLSSTDRRVVAFTAVPRRGFSGASPRNRFIDESFHAAAVARLYPNMEHVLVPNETRSPLDGLDRQYFLYEQPMLNPSNSGWSDAISDGMRARKIQVALSGSYGNHGFSYDGLELLPELIREGRLLRWWSAAHALVGPGRMRWRGALARTFGPWCPRWLWEMLTRHVAGYDSDITSYSAINPMLLSNLNLRKLAQERGLDLAYRPHKDAFTSRVWRLRRNDHGASHLGSLAECGIDSRDPTSDIRLLEFCLSVPTEQYLHKGVTRALARAAFRDRLPDMVLSETRKGLQAADWYEHLTAVRGELLSELERLESCAPVGEFLDLPRMRKLVTEWPTGGWEEDDIVSAYDLALMRGISAGHFLRRALGSNS